MNKLILVLASAICFFTSCRSTKKIQTAIAPRDSTVVVVKPIDHSGQDSANYIRETYSKVMANRINFTTFSGKIDVDYEDAAGKKYNVNAHLRMYKDSAIWISITAILGIEGLRAYITKDSVKLLDKQNKVYTARSVSYLQEMSSLPLTLTSLQDLLIGNPVFLDSTISNYSKAGNTISLLSNGSFFKNLFTIGEADKLPLSSKLDDADGLKNRTCHLTYDDYESKKGVNFPTKRTITVTEKGKLDIKLDFKQYDFNETLSFPFNIPKNYKQN